METPTETKRRPSRFRCLLRLPSFGVAVGLSLAALIAFAVWTFVDAEFSVTLEVARIDLGLQEHPGVDMTETHQWDELGARLFLLATLAVAAVLATLFVFYRLLFGSRQARSLRSLFLAVALVGVWLTFLLSNEKVQSAGYDWRIRRTVALLKEDAQTLLDEWPADDGTLPYCGRYVVEPENPHFLFLRYNGSTYSWSEHVGSFIARTDDGGLMFDYVLDKIEYHPDGHTPNSYTQSIRENGQEAYRANWILDYYIELEPNWFYASYKPELGPSPDEPAEKDAAVE